MKKFLMVLLSISTKWSLTDVADMEKAAKDILNAVKQYKDNLPTKR